MLKMLLKAVFISILLSMTSCNLNICNTQIVKEDPITPYRTKLDVNEFYAGATFEVPESPEEIYNELKRAHNNCNLNTITVYGLEYFSTERRNELFEALKRLDMKIVVRIESYGKSFAFTVADAEDVVATYDALLDFVLAPENRTSVAYLAINMPVDDPIVQKNAGGLNKSKWINAQVKYAEKIISLLRKKDSTIPLYLSVFYGWDNTFMTPSYESAGADGYFMNNYSYPLDFNFANPLSNGYDSLPSSSMNDSNLINAKRLKVSMDRFVSQYGDNVPLVMEWGFHTAEYNNKTATAQSAGLVKDKAAKEKALVATYDFYRRNYSFVKGFMYFGYNVCKPEGNPVAMMDWCLNYKVE